MGWDIQKNVVPWDGTILKTCRPKPLDGIVKRFSTYWEDPAYLLLEKTTFVRECLQKFIATL
jgi:hypothetical protein